MGRHVLLVNQFIKELSLTFNKDFEYRATSKDGKVFKSAGWDEANRKIERRLMHKKKRLDK